MSKLFIVAALIVQSSALYADERVDALFEEWDRPGSPGCALGVIQDGQFVYRRGYGSADLDHGIPLSSASVFRMASVSKQFAAFATLLAEQQGKLSLDDDIRIHVAELPVNDPVVTIRHLIHHSSGIRDYLTLMSLAGYDDDAIYSEADVLERLARQERSNFPAGSEFLYSNSGYFLLSQIVLRATGESLAEFSQRFIFGPLGMDDTHFHDDLRKIVKRRATGYRPHASEGWEIDTTMLDMVGDGGLYTSVDDLLAWDRNFYTGEVGGEDLRLKRLETPTLSGGERQNYASGVVVASDRGRETVSHGGSFVGYRTAMLMFPEERWSTYILCNTSSASATELAKSVAEILLPAGDTGAALSEASRSDRTSRLWDGVYWDAHSGELAELVVDGEKLLWKERELSFSSAGDDRFEASGEEPTTLEFAGRDPHVRMTVRQTGQRVLVYERVEAQAASDGVRGGLPGEYTCTELSVTYVVVGAPDGLVLTAPSFSSPMEAVFVDGYRWDDGSVWFTRSSTGEVTGFTLTSGRARNFWFDRR